MGEFKERRIGIGMAGANEGEDVARCRIGRFVVLPLGTKREDYAGDRDHRS
ncbi:hypothetical protein FBY34_8828 [Streptomyces sp. SLBN-115]|nr:hypothetical protein FBY34_8828 [Streptomyces sp. SLBN-115]